MSEDTQPQADPVSQVEQPNQTPPEVPAQAEKPADTVAPAASTPPTTPPAPEILLQKFLNGEAVEAHLPLTIVVGPMNIKTIAEGGFIIMPPTQLLIDYKK